VVASTLAEAQRRIFELAQEVDSRTTDALRRRITVESFRICEEAINRSLQQICQLLLPKQAAGALVVDSGSDNDSSDSEERRARATAAAAVAHRKPRPGAASLLHRLFLDRNAAEAGYDHLLPLSAPRLLTACSSLESWVAIITVLVAVRLLMHASHDWRAAAIRGMKLVSHALDGQEEHAQQLLALSGKSHSAISSLWHSWLLVLLATMRQVPAPLRNPILFIARSVAVMGCVVVKACTLGLPELFSRGEPWTLLACIGLAGAGYFMFLVVFHALIAAPRRLLALQAALGRLPEIFPVNDAVPDTSTPPSPDSFDVVVVGAGVSGLAAADELAKRGYRVCVVEARTRVGGRTFSVDADTARPAAVRYRDLAGVGAGASSMSRLRSVEQLAVMANNSGVTRSEDCSSVVRDPNTRLGADAPAWVQLVQLNDEYGAIATPPEVRFASAFTRGKGGTAGSRPRSRHVPGADKYGPDPNDGEVLCNLAHPRIDVGGQWLGPTQFQALRICQAAGIALYNQRGVLDVEKSGSLTRPCASTASSFATEG
jgi:hypothetical protein